jgi:hypothetical protein
MNVKISSIELLCVTTDSAGLLEMERFKNNEGFFEQNYFQR